ncbi:MAG: hypothetical protein PVJ83_10035, partial [Gammaproteobacteria bacterium]
MDLLKKIGSLFSGGDRQRTPVHWVYVRCNRCGEKIAARINLYNDLSLDYVDGKRLYYCRKVLVGQEKLCFQRVEIHLKFDERRNPIDREISGGVFITEE